MLREFFGALARGGVARDELGAEAGAALDVLVAQRAASGYKGRFYLNDGFAFGQLEVVGRGRCVVREFESGGAISVAPSLLCGAKNGDIVGLCVKRTRRTGSRGGRNSRGGGGQNSRGFDGGGFGGSFGGTRGITPTRLFIVKRARETRVVFTKRFGSVVLGVDFVGGAAQLLKLPPKTSRTLDENLVLKIAPDGEVLDVLGDLTSAAVDEKISLALYEKADEFSDLAQSEAAQAVAEFERDFGGEISVDFGGKFCGESAPNSNLGAANPCATNKTNGANSNLDKNPRENCNDFSPNLSDFKTASNAILHEKTEILKWDNLAKNQPQMPAPNQSQMPAQPPRRDLCALPFCTIDPDDAKDFDDAIYYNPARRELFVAIADVSHFVRDGSRLDFEAQQRAFSIYFPHKSVPMLPRVLSEGACSLKPYYRRFAMVFRLVFDGGAGDAAGAGNVSGGVGCNEPKIAELFSAIIISKRRFTYSEVDEILAKNGGDLGKNSCKNGANSSENSSENSPKNPADFSWILPLFEMTRKWRAARLLRGFDFKNRELRLELDENGALAATSYEPQTPAHSLVEECMLQANIAAARRISRGIFRSHAAPDARKMSALTKELAALGLAVKYTPRTHDLVAQIQTLADTADGGIGGVGWNVGENAGGVGNSGVASVREAVDAMLIRAQQKAHYTPFCEGHFGLGFSHYTHFTSPIRRYSDLILHRILKAQTPYNTQTRGFSGGENERENAGQNSAASGANSNLGALVQKAALICEELTRKEVEADRVAFDFADRKFARWAAQNVGGIFAGFVEKSAGEFAPKWAKNAHANTAKNANFAHGATTRKTRITRKNGTFAAPLGECVVRLVGAGLGARVFVRAELPLLAQVAVKITHADIAAAKIYGQIVRETE